ncbi:MAG: NAD(P)/FAD-dependent oxidoreductase, partial [Gammaproteobacteria bacterium]|nr:NAD(P)/FAD-dependent oxidoreductase [Gammaproteobacteria bacterium]
VIFQCPCKAAAIARNGDDLVVITDDYQSFTAKTVLLSIGLQYRRLNASNVGALMGRGVYYGMPPFAIPKGKKCLVAIVGGANSAGQAAVRVAENQKALVHLFIRKTIDVQMSTYLIDRLRNTPNVIIMEHCEIKEVGGRIWLKYIKYSCNGAAPITLDMDNMFIFIGAVPRTMWLDHIIELDDDRFVRTGSGVSHADNSVRRPMHYETSMQGVFAAGDARAYATKRISAAVGEGSAVVQQIHQYLASMG